jgi:molecular chaperone GrpE
MNEENIQQPENNTDQLQKELDNAINLLKRTAADFENYKRRKEAENKELVEFAKEAVVAKLLPTLDALSQALKHAPSLEDRLQGSLGDGIQGGFERQYHNWQQGINGIVIQLDKALEELGVRKIEAVGKKFDPHFHEAVREAESEAEDGTVIEELQSGFALNNKVIRPSQVIISRRKQS